MERVLLQDGVVDLTRGEVVRGERVLQLTPSEAAVLGYLASRPRQAVSRDELHREVWGHAPSVVSRAADYAVLRLRRKIERVPQEPERVLTVHGEGYRFEPLPAVAPAGFHGEVTLLVALPGEREPAQRWLHRIAAAARDSGATLADLDPDRAVLLVGDPGLADAVAGAVHASGPTRIGRGVGVPEVLVHPVSGRTLYGGTPLHDAVGGARRAAVGQTVQGGSADATSNLPHRTDTFVGRAALVEALRQGERVVVLVGPPGAGKSRLAEAAAGDVPGRAWRVRITPGTSPTRIREEVRDVGGLTDGGWVLLDDAEVAVQAVAAWLDEVHEPPFRVVVTSRERIPGSHVHVEVGGLPPDEAVALLRARGASGPTADLARLATALDGLPLALELAVPRLRVMSPTALAEGFGRRLALLGGAGAGRSMEAALEASWERLDAAERRVLVQATVFVAPASLADLDAVVDPGDHSQWGVDVVQSLCDKHLLQRIEPPDRPGDRRFVLLAVIRAFAVAQAERDRGLLGGAVRRHAQHVAGRLAALPKRGPVPDLRAQVAEATHAARVSLAAGWPEWAASSWVLAANLGYHAVHPDELLAMAPEVDALPVADALRARIAYGWALLAVRRNDWTLALTMAERTRRRATDPGGIGRAWLLTITAAVQQSDLELARTAAEAAAEAFREAGEPLGLLAAQRHQRAALYRLGRLVEARDLSLAALDEPADRAGGLGNLAADQLALGHLDAALESVRAALAANAPDNLRKRASLLQMLGAVRVARGDTEGATEALDEALALAHRLGAGHLVVFAEMAKVQMALERADWASVRARVDRLDAPTAWIRAGVLAVRAEERAAAGDAAAAQALMAEAQDLAADHADAVERVTVAVHAAMVAVHLGRLDEAAAALASVEAATAALGVTPAAPTARAVARLRRALATAERAGVRDRSVSRT